MSNASLHAFLECRGLEPADLLSAQELAHLVSYAEGKGRRGEAETYLRAFWCMLMPSIAPAGKRLEAVLAANRLWARDALAVAHDAMEALTDWDWRLTWGAYGPRITALKLREAGHARESEMMRDAWRRRGYLRLGKYDPPSETEVH